MTITGHYPSWRLSGNVMMFALSPEILSIVNSYFGMLTHLNARDLWHTRKNCHLPREFQLWHRDPNSHSSNLLKVFLSVENVSEKQGPLMYCRKTHPKETFGKHEFERYRE